MGKFLVRITVICVSFYLVICYFVAQFAAKNILSDWYLPLFELIVVIYAFSEGKYHCKYLKFLALSILCSDLITRCDNYSNIFSTSAHNLIPISLISISITYGVVMSLLHYIKVLQYKKKKYGYHIKPN